MIALFTGLVVLVLAGPVLVLGAAYVWVDRVLLAPRVPDETSGALDCVAFICDEKGLPRLSLAESEAFLLQQTRRIFNDVTFAKQFAAALRTSTPADQQDFHEHVFNAFKPLLMRGKEPGDDHRHAAKLQDAAVPGSDPG